MGSQHLIKRNPVKSILISDDFVEYWFPETIKSYYLEVNAVLNLAGIKTPKILSVEQSICVERLRVKDYFGLRINMLSPQVEDLNLSLHSCKPLNRVFDRRYIELRAPEFPFVEDILSGPKVFSHMDLSSVNIFEGPVLIDFEHAVMAPKEYDYIYRYFDPYTRRDPSDFETYVERCGLDLERSLKMGLFICQMVRHFVVDMGFFRPTLPTMQYYQGFIEDQLRVHKFWG